MKVLRIAAALAATLAATGAHAESTLRVGFCARTVSAAAAPFAIATKMGWFTQAGFRVELVPLPGSTDCVKSVATRDIDYSLPSIEPLAILRPQGIKIKNYYTAYQGNVYGIAVPAGSAIKRFEDLKGKRVGVISMASAGVIIARALAANHGMDPDRDISIVVAGEAGQTAALVRSGEVDALSQFDTQYALIDNAGVKMRWLDNREIEKFPSNGFIAFEETLKTKRADAVALAQGYAKGTVFALANPAAARFPAEMGGAQAEGRGGRHHHQRADRRHQQVRSRGDHGSRQEAGGELRAQRARGTGAKETIAAPRTAWTESCSGSNLG